MQNGLPGVIENRLNIDARQFRITAQNGVPGFPCSQLFQNRSYGNSRAFNDRLATADAGFYFNALAHALNHTHWG